MPYDVFSNTVLQEVMAGWLGVTVGEYVHSVDSLHIYEHDVAAARGVLAANPAVGARGDEADVDLAVDAAELDRVLAAVLDGPSSEMPDGWRSYAANLASYRCWKRGLRAEAIAYAEAVQGPLRGALLRWYVRHVDVDDLTLAPAGYDLAKLLLSWGMIHGRRPAVEDVLDIYNASAGQELCNRDQLAVWLELHHVLTFRYRAIGHYAYAWPALRTPADRMHARALL
jgi:hypothetical protein